MMYTPKGLALAVLRAVPELGTLASGTAICGLLEKRQGKEIDVQTIYLALQRLEARGLVASHRETATEKAARNAVGRRGHPRRVYDLTTSGRTALDRGLAVFLGAIPHQEDREYAEAETSVEATAKG